MATTEIAAPDGVPYIDLTREFEASREMLFRAYTEPELLVQWLGPRKYTLVIDRFELRDGGMWRYVHRAADGTEYGFHGVFHGQPSPDGMVQTFEFEGWPGHVALDSLRFEERGSTTVVHTHSVYQSVADRDAMVEGGMEAGVRDGFDRLAELLARLVPVG
jgi:uncharacterized protein YndB with AHSA1/START domain